MQSKRQTAAVLSGVVLAVSLTVAVRYEPYTFIRRDASFYATIARGLVTNLSLDQRKVQPQSWYSGQHPGYANLDMYWSDVSVGRGGTWYPKHPFLVSVAAAPFYLLFGVPGFLIFNVLCVIVMLMSAYLIAARIAPAAAGAMAVAFIAACPTLVDHTYLLSADVFNATLIAAGTLLLYQGRLRTAGMVLGLALWARPVTGVLVVPVAAAALLGRIDRRQFRDFVIAAAIPLAVAGIANTIMYGAPWVTSYDRILVVENRVPTTGSARDLFTNTVDAGVRLMFLDREHGLLANALPALIAVFGLVPLARHDWRLAAGMAVALVGFVVAYVRYRYFNARFFFAWQALLIVPLAALLGDVGALVLSGARRARVLGPRLSAGVSRIPKPAMAALLVAILFAGVVARWVRGRHYVLSQHVAEAKVFRNDFPCDYFNMTHLAWECSRLDRSSEEYTGLAVSDKRCRFGGSHRESILIGPPPGGGTRRVAFEPTRRGRLSLDYGIEAGSGAGQICVAVAYGGRPSEQVCATGAGTLQRRELPALVEGEPNRLEIVASGLAPRAFCFDGTIEP
jgi:hypothetical protein